jgi:hypothetical protein
MAQNAQAQKEEAEDVPAPEEEMPEVEHDQSI